MIPRHYALLLAFLLAAHITGCRTVPRPVERANAGVVPPPVALDSSRTAAPPVAPAPAPVYNVVAGVALPKHCKKCVVNVVAGDQTNLTAGKKAQVANGPDASVVVTGKKSGPAVIKSDSTAFNVAGANAQQTTTNGNNNQVAAKKQDTTVEPAGVWATIAKALTGPLGIVLGLAAAAGIAYGVYYFWFLIPRRKSAPTPNSNAA